MTLAATQMTDEDLVKATVAAESNYRYEDNKGRDWSSSAVSAALAVYRPLERECEARGINPFLGRIKPDYMNYPWWERTTPEWRAV